MPVIADDGGRIVADGPAQRAGEDFGHFIECIDSGPSQRVGLAGVAPHVSQHIRGDNPHVAQIDEGDLALARRQIDAVVLHDVGAIGRGDVLGKEAGAENGPILWPGLQVLLRGVVRRHLIVARAGHRDKDDALKPGAPGFVDEDVQRLFGVGDRGRTQEKKRVAACHGSGVTRRVIHVEIDDLCPVFARTGFGRAGDWRARAGRRSYAAR